MKEIVFQTLLQICIYERSICMGILKAEIFHITIELTPMLPNPAENGKKLFHHSVYLYFPPQLVYHVTNLKNSNFHKTVCKGKIISKDISFRKGQPISQGQVCDNLSMLIYLELNLFTQIQVSSNVMTCIVVFSIIL